MEEDNRDYFKEMTERDLIDVIESMIYLMPDKVNDIPNFKKLRNESLKFRKTLLSNDFTINTKKRQVEEYINLLNENPGFKKFIYSSYSKYINYYRLRFVIDNYEEYKILSTTFSQSKYINKCIKSYLDSYENNVILNFGNREHIFNNIDDKYKSHIRTILIKLGKIKVNNFY